LSLGKQLSYQPYSNAGKIAQTTLSYFGTVDVHDAAALMKLIVESSLKVSVEGV
jgi:hypothetical protein